MKKFYKTVSIRQSNNHFIILLDDRKLLTPLKNELALKTKDLATAVMQEWAAQDKSVIPALMPITQMVMTIQDMVTPKRHHVSDEVLKFLATDLVLYSSPDQHLNAFQMGLRQPYIDFFNRHWGLMLSAQEALAPHKIDQESEGRIQDDLATLSNDALGALQFAVAATGSFILAFHFIAMPDVSGVVQAVYAEEIYYDQKNKQAGLPEDPDLKVKKDELTLELQNIKHFLSLIS